MKYYIVMQQDSVLVMAHQHGRWQLDIRLEGLPVNCIATDPHIPERVYCGTFGKGLWRSSDAGETWEPVGEGITHPEIMSVAVSQAERVGKYGVVWAGTEPSAVFRSEDGGNTWQERPALLDLPSRPTWSYPPRPHTHHVRWIQPDPLVPERLFVAIEQGGVMRSLDNGLTWEDRKPGAQLDGHSMKMHKLAPGRLYEAAGGEKPEFVDEPLGRYVVMQKGGYAETRDGGATWETQTEGFGHHYLWSVAVDPGNADTVLVSACRGPEQAHRPPTAESFLYRRTAGTPWQLVSEGLPEARGSLVYDLATNEAEPGVFYAATNRGAFRSADAGQSWEKLALAWPERYAKMHVRGTAIVP
ncbi:MAG TPA: glycosyl hydrolase [Ktedonobacterales bacterium]|jgi:photosystem II stability/assembly factor-like uncharacterized protein